MDLVSFGSLSANFENSNLDNNQFIQIKNVQFSPLNESLQFVSSFR